MTAIPRIVLRWLVAVALAFVGAASATTPPPRDLTARAGFDQHVGASLDLHARVRDDAGHEVGLRALADGKPLVLAFGYYRCPNLCDLTLHGMAAALARIPLDPASDYRVVFLSVDPGETAGDARQASDMLRAMDAGAAARIAHWTFATAAPDTIASLTAAVGFRYYFDAGIQQYVHPAGLVIVTPDGHIAQYFFGVDYAPDALRLALVDASGGRLGNVIDQFVLLCCGYDPATGRYSLLVSRIMIVLGSLFVLAMGIGVYRLARRTR